MNISIPELSLIALIGPSGSGKSTFARRHFRPTEVLSSDACRGWVSDDENSMEATNDAFELLHFLAAKRLERGRLVVVDATNVQAEARRPLVDLARTYHCLPVAIVLNLPERECQERNKGRPERNFGSHVIRQHKAQLRRSLRGLEREGFRHVFVLNSSEEIDAVTIERQPLWNNLRHEHGPFDIIGDVHGCCDELMELLSQLGYVASASSEDTAWPGPIFAHPLGRKAIFLGDLGDRGPRIVDTFRVVHNMVAAGTGLCVPGNHDIKLFRCLRGRKVQVTHGLDRTLAEIEGLPAGDEKSRFERELAEFIDDMVSHYVLDDGKLVVAHAGMKQEMQGRGSGKVREFALYGETTGETDEFGLPVRFNWAAEYRGAAMVVYGHTPVPEPEWLNRTINIDTGCVFGGRLTALRYPERELVSVQSKATYCLPSKPFLAHDTDSLPLSAQQIHDDVLSVDELLSKLIISTRLGGSITIREEQAHAAVEVMSRFAVSPKWLIYLPPTMSPCETSEREGLLEHPAEAFAYYRQEGIPRVICQQKHMGSRAVVVLCRNEDVAARRFGIVNEGIGVCTTRTGRPFFKDASLQLQLLERVRAACDKAGVWDELESDWLCLDAELMPWSAKAMELIQNQYAAVGAAATASLEEVVYTLRAGAASNSQLAPLLERFEVRQRAVSAYVDAYQRYCWNVADITDYKLAPFHLLASENAVHSGKDHQWHMRTLNRLCLEDEAILLSTPNIVVDTTDEKSQEAATEWWSSLTAKGGEGMVVKPMDFVAKGRRRLTQPAIKVRGREYLRIIYGPDYTAEENLSRLRSRGLGLKRSLAAREFALGIEAFERFVRHEPLRRVHECVFGVLALESEPVDPRL